MNFIKELYFNIEFGVKRIVFYSTVFIWYETSITINNLL